MHNRHSAASIKMAIAHAISFDINLWLLQERHYNWNCRFVNATGQ